MSGFVAGANRPKDGKRALEVLRAVRPARPQECDSSILPWQGLLRQGLRQG